MVDDTSPVTATTSTRAVLACWARLLTTAAECGMDTDAWELREPSTRAGHWIVQWHDGPHGPEARPLGRRRAEVVVTLKAIEAALRHLPGWKIFHDRLPAGRKSWPSEKTEPRAENAKSWPPKKTEPAS